MERSNYALISALYDSKTGGLYSDIYYPIIKYAIIKQYAKKPGLDNYSTVDSVQNLIKELFGIKIPHVVIVMTLRKLAARPSSNIQIELYQDDSFHIKSAMFDEEENSYEEKEHEFKAHTIEIETAYKEFLVREGVAGDDVSFVQFISTNTENILGYFANQSEEEVDEKYVTIIFFLDYLNRNNNELFRVANKLFWSSILVAFLESERPMVDDSDTGVPSEYYLDTSIVMGLLDLSTPEREQCSKEVCDVIKASGGLLKIHPLTIEEIKTILQSVETNGANEGSSIASAYTRRKLNAVKVAQIRVNLNSLIEKEMIQVFPSSMRDAKREAMYSYRGKEAVRQLAGIRRNVEPEYTTDNFREVHDIYMDDYIKKARKDCKGREDIYFLTSNRDLIDFCKDTYHPGSSYMISTASVILELWMHNNQPSDISSCMLTETMARCLDAHRAKTRKKIHEVASFFKEAKEEFDPNLYRDLLRNLYRKARHVIKVVDADPEDPKDYMQRIQEAVGRDNTHFDSTNSDMAMENSRLTEAVDMMGEKVADLSKESEAKSQQIGGLQEQNQSLSNSNKELIQKNEGLSSDLQLKDEELAKERATKDELRKQKTMAETKNQLYEKRDKLQDELVGLRASFKHFDDQRTASFCNWQPILLISIGGLLAFIFVVLVVLDKADIYKVTAWPPYVGLVTLACGLIGAGIAINTDERRNRRRNIAYEKWESLEDNKDYKALKEQIEKKEEDLSVCNNLIKNPTSFLGEMGKWS